MTTRDVCGLKASAVSPRKGGDLVLTELSLQWHSIALVTCGDPVTAIVFHWNNPVQLKQDA